MIKIKHCQTLPDPANTPIWSFSLSLSLSLSFPLVDLALSRWVSRVFSLSLASAVHPDGAPWILPRLDPGSLSKRPLPRLACLLLLFLKW